MGLEELAQDVADELQLPVVVFDTEMHVVAFSTHESDVDAVRKGIILTRRGSAKSVEMIAEYRVGSSRQPVRLPASDQVPSRILVPLRHNDHLVGYLSCLDADDQLDLLPAQLELLDTAAHRLSDLMAVRALEEIESRERESDLLERLLNDSADIRSAAALEAVAGGHLPRAEGYSVLLVDDLASTDPPSPASRLAVADAVMLMARSLGGGTLHAVLSHGAAVLVSPRPADPARVSRILERPEFRMLRSGEGSRRPLTELAASHREAAIALRCAKLDPRRTSRSAVWSELGLDALLIQLPLETLGVDDLPSALRTLFAASNRAVLVPTLQTYLEAGGDALDTSRRLLIHRSTLYYRLDKIKAMTEVDLADGEVRRELHTGLRVAELAGLWVSPASIAPQKRLETS